MSFFRELRRRNVFKVGTAYAIVAWLLIQVADVVLPALQMPQWTVSFVAVLMILGFPITLIMAWAYEMTPEGIRAASRVRSTESVTQVTGLMLNYVIVGLLVLVMAFIVVDQYVLEPRGNAFDSGLSAARLPVRTSESVGLRRFQINLGSGERVGDTGLNAHVAISPDGGRVVYAAQSDGTAQLYLRAIDQLEARPIRGTEGAANPFFSPDGQWVAFFSDFGDRKLKKVNVAGGPAVPLADAPIPPGGTWRTPETIVFSTRDEHDNRSMFRILANGGTPEVVLAGDAEQGYIWSDVLPGGDAVLITIRPVDRPAREGRVAVLSLASGEYRDLVQDAYYARYAPTGHLVFVRAGALWAVPFDAETLETTGPEVPVLDGVQTDGQVGSTAYAFSASGTLVYVPGDDVSADSSAGVAAAGTGSPLDDFAGRLVWVDRDGNEQALELDERIYGDPRISPDGERLAVIVTAQDSTDVWIYDFNRGVISRRTFTGEAERVLWSPDGERLVAAGLQGYGLWWISADGTGQPEMFTDQSRRLVPEAFSPDGTQLVYRERTVADNLYVLSVDDRIEQPLIVTEEYPVGFSAISPDGAWIAYNSGEMQGGAIYVRPFPNVDDGKWQISADGGIGVRWSPDGKELYYRRRSDNSMLAVSIQTVPSFIADTPRILFRGDYSIHTAPPGYDISPDGERFLMLKDVRVGGELSESNEAALVVVENWFQELVRLAPPSR